LNRDIKILLIHYLKEGVALILSLKDYRSSVLGCWMGKSIGGTLGAPMEWRRQVNNVTFYTQETDGNPLPNDDLDLQLVWLVALEEKGIDIDATVLAEYWLTYITPHWAEYGAAKINLKGGMQPPYSGMENNPHKDSCGAFIRSEIWACIAPGHPEVAVRYACEDAKVDHGNGEGTYAEIFCAAMESAAFVVKDIHKLIDIGLSYIPETSGVARVVRMVVEEYRAGRPYLDVRDEIMRKYRAQYMAYAGISQEDRDKGFADGPVGWDAPANIGYVVIGLLYGEGDFEKSICYTVNCGEDTDCTGATVGSIFGIIHGVDAIPEKWIKPIGRSIKTMCINLGELPGVVPPDIDNLSKRVEAIAKQVALRYIPGLELSEVKETDLTGFDSQQLYHPNPGKPYYPGLDCCLHKFNLFHISVEYPDGPYIKNNTPARVKVKIANKYKTPQYLKIKWYFDEDITVTPSRSGKVFCGTWRSSEAGIDFEISVPVVKESVVRGVLEVTVEGRHTVMLVPVALLNGNFRS